MRYFRLLRALVRAGVLAGSIILLSYAALGAAFFVILTFPQPSTTDWNHLMTALNAIFSSQPLQTIVQYTAPSIAFFGPLVFTYTVVQMAHGGFKESELDEMIAQIKKRQSKKL